MTTAPTAAATASTAAHPRRWLALGVLLAAAFMDLLDVTIVNIALPGIRANLGASYAASQWVVAGYTLAFGLGLITGGRLGDRFGRKRVFLAGVTVFVMASAACATASGPGILIATRVVQGAASAMMIPQVMATVYAIFPTNERGNASAAYGAVTGLAAVCGPVIGGLFVAYDVLGLGWRAAFWVNVPLGIAAVFGALFLVPETKSERPLRMDLLGAVLITASLLLVLYPLVQGRSAGWPGWMVAAVIAGAPVLLGYALHARAKERRDHSALVPPRLFGTPGFSAGAAVLFLFCVTMIGFFLAISLTLQIGLGFSAIFTGLVFLPWAIGAALVSGSANAMIDRLGRHLISLGALVMAAGMIWFSLALHAGSSWPELAPGLFLAGLGMGAVTGPSFTVAGAQVEGGDAGAAAGSLSASVQLGNATGAALLSVLFFTPLAAAAPGAVSGHEDELRGRLAAAAVSDSDQDAIAGRLRDCFVARSRSDDPEASPADCRTLAQQTAARPAAVRKAVEEATDTSRAEMFTDTFHRYVWFAVAGLILVALLAQTMPRRISGYEGEDGAAQH